MKLTFSYDTEKKDLVVFNDQGEIFDNVTSVSVYKSMAEEGKFDCYISKSEKEDGMEVYETYTCVAKADKIKEAIKSVFKNG